MVRLQIFPLTPPTVSDKQPVDPKLIADEVLNILIAGRDTVRPAGVPAYSHWMAALF